MVVKTETFCADDHYCVLARPWYPIAIRRLWTMGTSKTETLYLMVPHCLLNTDEVGILSIVNYSATGAATGVWGAAFLITCL